MNTQTPTQAPVQETTPQTTSRPADYAIYKPNSRGSGGVVRFGLNRQRAAVFVDAANQSGEKQFDWENKITMKWGLADLGAALAVLQARQPQAKLFHQSEKASTAFELVARTEADRAPYLLQISRQDAATKAVQKVVVPLTHAEACVLEAACKAAVVRLVGW